MKYSFLKNKILNRLFKIFYGGADWKYFKNAIISSKKKTLLFVSCYSILENLAQRPEHLFEEFISRGWQVVAFDSHIKFSVQFKKNLFLAPMSFFYPLLRETDIIPTVMSISTHFSLPHIERTLLKLADNGIHVIYEHLDDFDLWNNDLKRKRILLKRFSALCKSEKILITVTANSLRKQAIKFRGSQKNIVTVKNAARPEDFTIFSKETPSELKSVKRKHKPIIGYYGCIIDDWFDYKIMDSVIKNNPDWEFVFIGPLNGEKCKQLTAYPNCTHISPIPYEKLPAYAALFDVAMIPFQLNNITKSTNPVKLFEYMALKKPIVTTPLVECKEYKSCLIASSATEFTDCIQRALKLKNSKVYLGILSQELKENSWKARVDVIEQALEELK